MFRILVALHDNHIRHYFHKILSYNGYKIYCADSSDEAMVLIDEHHFDLLLIDAILPDTDGFTLTNTLRNCGNTTPVFMIAPEYLDKEVKKAFRMGVDDFMVYPLDEDELLLRIRAILRRSGTVSERVLIIGNTTLEYDTLTVSSPEAKYTLPPKEFYLLYKLLSSPDHIFTREQLLDDIWGPETESDPATISVHINRLRNRFAHNRNFTIQTIRGLGYRASITSE